MKIKVLDTLFCVFVLGPLVCIAIAYEWVYGRVPATEYRYENHGWEE
jgi:hypothetical protein